MLIPEAAQYLKSRVPMEAVLRLYGYPEPRAGMMCCPFHARDKTPSLKVYPDHWYCFGCHAGGSVLDFVMYHESCSFPLAVRALDKAMNLNLLTVDPWEDQESYRTLQRLLDEAESTLLQAAAVEKDLVLRRLREDYNLWRTLDQIPKQSRTAEDWLRWQNALEGLYYLEDLLSSYDAYTLEVRQWRNNARLRKPRPLTPGPKSAPRSRSSRPWTQNPSSRPSPSFA